MTGTESPLAGFARVKGSIKEMPGRIADAIRGMTCLLCHPSEQREVKGSIKEMPGRIADAIRGMTGTESPLAVEHRVKGSVNIINNDSEK